MAPSASFADRALIADMTAKMLIEVGAVLFNAEKPFIFTSGWASPVYIDCRKLISYPRLRRTLIDFSASTILREVGFADPVFYYPLPDYKLPTEMFSDAYLPSTGHPVRGSTFPAPCFTGERLVLFDEMQAMEGIIEDGAFPFFANSFLVVASR